MKKLVACLVVAGMVFGTTHSALAVAPFGKHFTKKYVEDNKDAPEGFAEVVKEAKCNVCHYGKSKKNRNDYGQALDKLLDKDDFKTSKIKADPEAAEKAMDEAFDKVAKMKNADGVLFGDLIKEGKLPGTAPEDDGEE